MCTLGVTRANKLSHNCCASLTFPRSVLSSATNKLPRGAASQRASVASNPTRSNVSRRCSCPRPVSPSARTVDNVREPARGSRDYPRTWKTRPPVRPRHFLHPRLPVTLAALTRRQRPTLHLPQRLSLIPGREILEAGHDAPSRLTKYPAAYAHAGLA